jgi:hypothetical protein
MKVKTQVKAGQPGLIQIVVGNNTSKAPIDNRAGAAGIIAIGGEFNS